MHKANEEDGNFKLSVTYSPALWPHHQPIRRNLTPCRLQAKRFSPQTTGEFWIFEHEPFLFLAWPCNKPFSAPNLLCFSLIGLTVHWAHKLLSQVYFFSRGPIECIALRSHLIHMPSSPLLLCLCTWEKAILMAFLQGSPWSSPSIYSKGLFSCCQFSYSSHTLAPSAHLIWSKCLLSSEGMFTLWELLSGFRDVLTLSPTNINTSYTFHSHLLTPSWGHRNFQGRNFVLFCFSMEVFLIAALFPQYPLYPHCL